MKSIMILTGLAYLTASAAAQVVVDLRNGSIHDLGANPQPVRAQITYTNPFVTVNVTRNTGCVATPFQALIQLNLTPAGQPVMKRVWLDVDYAGSTAAEPNLPTGWVTHIGDDSANDGFGGGSGLDGVAEVHVNAQMLDVYSSALGPGLVQRVLHHEMQLDKGSIRFEIANQFLSFGQLQGILDASQAKKLFALPDQKGDSRLFIGLNRVASGRTDRRGCGAARAIVQLEP